MLLLLSHQIVWCISLKLIREHGSIEKIISTLDRKKYTVPSDWVPNEKGGGDDDDTTDGEMDDDENVVNDQDDEIVPTYVQARALFHNHETTTDVELKWTKPDSEALMKFLVDEQGFSAERVKSNIEKLEAAYKANLKPQSRMDSFFTVKPNPAADAKRKQKLQDEMSKKKQKVADKKRGGSRKK